MKQLEKTEFEHGYTAAENNHTVRLEVGTAHQCDAR